MQAHHVGWMHGLTSRHLRHLIEHYTTFNGTLAWCGVRITVRGSPVYIIIYVVMTRSSRFATRWSTRIPPECPVLRPSAVDNSVAQQEESQPWPTIGAANPGRVLTTSCVNFLLDWQNRGGLMHLDKKEKMLLNCWFNKNNGIHL